MVRRSAWARQSQSEKRAIRRKYSAYPKIPGMLEPWLIDRKIHNTGIDLKDGTVWNFLNTHKGDLRFMMRHVKSTVEIPGLAGITEQNASQVLASFLEDKKRCPDPKKVFRELVLGVIHRAWFEGAAPTRAVYTKHYIDFLRERHIPCNEKSRIDIWAFENTLRYVLNKKIFPIYGTGYLDATAFEKMYLILRKKMKHDSIELGGRINDLVKTAFHGTKADSKLLKRKKKLLFERAQDFETNLVIQARKMIDEREKQGNPMTQKEILDLQIAEEQKFQDSMLDELKRVAQTLPKRKTQEPPNEEIKQRFRRKAELQQKALVARKTEIPFDPIADSLGRIRERNPTAAQNYGKLIINRVLNKGQFMALHIHGTRAERIFLEAFESPEFQHQFGPKGANDLAKIVAYIGGGAGHKKERVRNIAGPIYDFLQNHGYITLHTGSRVAYLSQPKPNGNGHH